MQLRPTGMQCCMPKTNTMETFICITISLEDASIDQITDRIRQAGNSVTGKIIAAMYQYRNGTTKPYEDNQTIGNHIHAGAEYFVLTFAPPAHLPLKKMQ